MASVNFNGKKRKEGEKKSIAGTKLYHLLYYMPLKQEENTMRISIIRHKGVFGYKEGLYAIP